MAWEIERKFLVCNDGWRDHVDRQVRYRQGYLAAGAHCSVRVRVGGEQAYINIKGASVGTTRREFEYPVTLEDAHIMLQELCTESIVEKTRYYLRHENRGWEVDVFEGDNAGLVVAEIELEDEAQTFALPPWVGEEVTDDVRYYNASLAVTPFSEW